MMTCTKFDEIVAFAEIDKFLDTPVKRYSSGMYVRLAFAVAAHLEPEILIVDEVLAVGDALFQKKCLGKMGEISQHGRTVLFVSHSMPMIQSLCQRAVLLSSGTLTNIGEVNSVVQAYLADGVTEERGVVDAKGLPRSAGYEKVIRRIWIEDQFGEVINSVNMGGEIVLCFEFKTSKPIRDVGVGFGIETPQQMRLVSFNNYILNKEDVSVSGVAIARCRIPQITLLPGKYYCSFSVVQGQREWVDYIERATVFDVVAVDVHGTGRTLQPGQGVFWSPAYVYVEVLNQLNGSSLK